MAKVYLKRKEKFNNVDFDIGIDNTPCIICPGYTTVGYART